MPATAERSADEGHGERGESPFGWAFSLVICKAPTVPPSFWPSVWPSLDHLSCLLSGHLYGLLLITYSAFSLAICMGFSWSSVPPSLWSSVWPHDHLFRLLLGPLFAFYLAIFSVIVENVGECCKAFSWSSISPSLWPLLCLLYGHRYGLLLLIYSAFSLAPSLTSPWPVLCLFHALFACSLAICLAACLAFTLGGLLVFFWGCKFGCSFGHPFVLLFGSLFEHFISAPHPHPPTPASHPLEHTTLYLQGFYIIFLCFFIFLVVCCCFVFYFCFVLGGPLNSSLPLSSFAFAFFRSFLLSFSFSSQFFCTVIHSVFYFLFSLDKHWSPQTLSALD